MALGLESRCFQGAFALPERLQSDDLAVAKGEEVSTWLAYHDSVAASRSRGVVPRRQTWLRTSCREAGRDGVGWLFQRLAAADSSRMGSPRPGFAGPLRTTGTKARCQHDRIDCGVRRWPGTARSQRHARSHFSLAAPSCLRLPSHCRCQAPRMPRASCTTLQMPQARSTLRAPTWRKNIAPSRSSLKHVVSGTQARSTAFRSFTTLRSASHVCSSAGSLGKARQSFASGDLEQESTRCSGSRGRQVAVFPKR